MHVEFRVASVHTEFSKSNSSIHSTGEKLTSATAGYACNQLFLIIIIIPCTADPRMPIHMTLEPRPRKTGSTQAPSLSFAGSVAYFQVNL
ncbi:hypothetical protein Mapa_004373 [Marchantia paleacea]|nr:hypothetical protein Mapa_004373 [Marchantia paleacea]